MRLKIAKYIKFETVGKLGVVFKHKVYRKMLALLDFVLLCLNSLLNQDIVLLSRICF